MRIDLRDLENVSDLDKVEILAESLSTRVGSLLSYRSFAEEIAVSDKTIKRWIEIFDRLYLCYLILPYGAPKIKATKKSKKLYMWDWSQVEDPGSRFENLVASHLLKLVDYWQDVLGYRSELRYIRDDKGVECDFVVLREKKPVFAVECKLNDTATSSSLLILKSKMNIPHWYQVHLGDKKKIVDPNFTVLGFQDFCREVDLI